MQQAIKVFFSPMAFALGFLWPLATQVLIALSLFPPGWQPVLAGAVIAIAFGLMAQFRGSWIWIK
jgi:hypothetical protein